MKILIYIDHPAHAHYFKNMIKIIEKKSIKFIFIILNFIKTKFHICAGNCLYFLDLSTLIKEI